MEEDIKILEEFIEEARGTDPLDNSYFNKETRAIENLIQRFKVLKAEYKREQYRNELLENKNKELEENLNYRVRYCNILEKELYGENSVELTKLEDKYFVSKSKVKEKKKELDDKDLEIYDTDSEDVIIAKYEERAVLDFCNSILED